MPLDLSDAPRRRAGVVLAIDPGVAGALAWVTRDGHLIDVDDMPTAKVRDRNKIIGGQLAAMMQARPIDYVLIEGVGPRPRESAMASFSFGYGAGLLEGIASGLGLPVHIVSSATWKRKAGVPADKNGARHMACRLWPGASDQFRRVKDDGRAEAALMARWAVLGGVQA